jgi:Leucine-rich repeat (LRR) protein
LKKIINISENVIYLDCRNNIITELDNLPSKLVFLDCSYNNITNLDNLPLGLKILICMDNNINSLDNLVASLCLLPNSLHLWRFKTPIFYNNLYINYYKNYLILL